MQRKISRDMGRTKEHLKAKFAALTDTVLFLRRKKK
jgi:hypothetical protein